MSEQSNRQLILAQRLAEQERAKGLAKDIIKREEAERKYKLRGKHTLTIYLNNKDGLFFGKLDPSTMLSQDLNKEIKITSKALLTIKKLKKHTIDYDKKDKNYKLILNLNENTINAILNQDSREAGGNSTNALSVGKIDAVKQQIINLNSN